MAVPRVACFVVENGLKKGFQSRGGGFDKGDAFIFFGTKPLVALSVAAAHGTLLLCSLTRAYHRSLSEESLELCRPPEIVWIDSQGYKLPSLSCLKANLPLPKSPELWGCNFREGLSWYSWRVPPTVGGSPLISDPTLSAFWWHGNISRPTPNIGEETSPRHAAPVAVSTPRTGASASVMSAGGVAGHGSKQKKSEWENLLGAAHLELRAQEAGPLLEADTADANARVPYSNTPYGAGANRPEAAAAATPSAGLRLATYSTISCGGGVDFDRGAAHRVDRGDAARLLADCPKASLGCGSMADPATCASAGATILTKTAATNYATEAPCPVGLSDPPSRRRVACALKAESRSAAVSSTTSPPAAVPSACGMVAAAAPGILVGEKHRNVRVEAIDAANESLVRLAHPRVKGMGRRGPLGQSHFKGVSITRAGTWRAVIYKGRKQQYLGVFDSEFDAARAYDAAALRLFPEGAPLNNPDLVERQLNEISAADGKPIATAGTPDLPHEEESPQAWEA